MNNGVFGMNNYASLFTSPIKSYEAQPITNLMYGSITSKIYGDTVSKNLQKTLSSYVAPLKDFAKDLKAAALSLAGEKGKTNFNQKTLATSDNTSISGTAKNEAALGSFKINVSRLASYQVNKGNILKTNDAAAFSAGVNTFEIKNSGFNKKVSFEVTAGESNQKSLEKMALAINGSKTGISAKVVTDKEQGNSYLSVTSDKTGKDNGFTIEDSYGGNAVNVAGANTVEKASNDSKYKVDGTEYTSSSNTISLANGHVQVTLKKAEEKDLSIDITRNSAAIDKNVSEFITQYNHLVDQVKKSSESSASRIIQRLDNSFTSNRSSLEHIGITKNADSTLSIDNQKFENSVSKDFNAVTRAFNSQNGLAKKASDIAGNMMYSPANYSKTNQLNKAGLTGMYVDMFI